MFLPGVESGLDAKLQHSIDLLQTYASIKDPFFGCFSGGKDSVVIKEVLRLAGVNVRWHYHNTTIDPPELVRFIQRQHKDVIWTTPKHGNFFRRMEAKGFPTRVNRWCCAEYKETAGPPGAQRVVGVRSAESARRAAAWSEVTLWRLRVPSYVIAPILSWSDDDVWTFIREQGLPYCELYDQGWKRIGCVGCPMSGKKGKRRDFDRWPRYEALWRRSFQRIWDRRTGTLQRDGRAWFGNAFFHGWEEMWEWWLSGDRLPATKLIPDEDEEDSCQLALNMLSGGGGEV